MPQRSSASAATVASVVAHVALVQFQAPQNNAMEIRRDFDVLDLASPGDLPVLFNYVQVGLGLK